MGQSHATPLLYSASAIGVSLVWVDSMETVSMAATVSVASLVDCDEEEART